MAYVLLQILLPSVPAATSIHLPLALASVPNESIGAGWPGLSTHFKIPATTLGARQGQGPRPRFAATAIAASPTRRARLKGGCQTGDRGRRREPAIPAALQPRLQSHRNGLRQAQGPVARRRGANHPRPLASYRRRPSPLHPTRMRQLPRRRRIRCNVNGKGSRHHAIRPAARSVQLSSTPSTIRTSRSHVLPSTASAA